MALDRLVFGRGLWWEIALAGWTLGAAASVGLKAEGVQVSREALPDVPTPCIGWTNRDHYVVVCGFNGRGEHGTATIQDANENAPRTVSLEKLNQATGGYLLTLRR